MRCKVLVATKIYCYTAENEPSTVLKKLAMFPIFGGGRPSSGEHGDGPCARKQSWSPKRESGAQVRKSGNEKCCKMKNV